MKHLKKFKIEDSIKDLETQYLAYLTDAGFIFNLREYKLNEWCIYITKNIFTWKDIKYDFIAFLEVFMKHYVVSAVNIHAFNFISKENNNQTYIYGDYSDNPFYSPFYSSSIEYVFTIDDLFKDKVTNNKLIRIDILFKDVI
jgi:hypothetical protein